MKFIRLFELAVFNESTNELEVYGPTIIGLDTIKQIKIGKELNDNERSAIQSRLPFIDIGNNCTYIFLIGNENPIIVAEQYSFIASILNHNDLIFNF